MGKAGKIRLFFILSAALCCAAYGGGYYYMQRQTPKPEPIEQAAEAEEYEIVESGTLVLPYEYILKEEDGYVVVYYADGETLYDNTAIMVEQLPWRLQREIRGGKQISSETELYNFLENYSS